MLSGTLEPVWRNDPIAVTGGVDCGGGWSESWFRRLVTSPLELQWEIISGLRPCAVQFRAVFVDLALILASNSRDPERELCILLLDRGYRDLRAPLIHTDEDSTRSRFVVYHLQDESQRLARLQRTLPSPQKLLGYCWALLDLFDLGIANTVDAEGDRRRREGAGMPAVADGDNTVYYLVL